jgi:hypothetical protein
MVGWVRLRASSDGTKRGVVKVHGIDKVLKKKQSRWENLIRVFISVYLLRVTGRLFCI